MDSGLFIVLSSMDFSENRFFKEISKHRNPFVMFSPFLLFFSIYVFYTHQDKMQADEGTYVQFAQNLLNGFYSPAAPDINLWCGPGYPIILMPFLALGLPLISITLLNVLFQYFSIVLLYKSSIRYVSHRFALGISLFWAFCYPAYWCISLIHTETFTWFLLTLLMYHLINCFSESSKKYIYYAGILLGYTALTKIIFGYVILALFGGLIVILLFNKEKNIKKSLMVLSIAFMTAAPYLVYTYTITGRVFYWGNSGGMSLYWMSTPHEMEYGDWNNEAFNALNDAELTGSPELLKKTHQNDINKISQLNGIEKDDAYKKIAIDNIKSNPIKYLNNVISNLSRAFFGFPHTYSYQRPFLKIWYFSIVFTLVVVSLILTLLNLRKIDYSVIFLFFLMSIYLGGSLLLSMENRMFLIIVPFILFWFAYSFSKAFNVKDISEQSVN